MSNVGEEGGVCNKKTMTIGKGREKEEEEEKMGKRQDGKRYVQRSFLFFLAQFFVLLVKMQG